MSSGKRRDIRTIGIISNWSWVLLSSRAGTLLIEHLPHVQASVTPTGNVSGKIREAQLTPPPAYTGCIYWRCFKLEASDLKCGVDFGAPSFRWLRNSRDMEVWTVASRISHMLNWIVAGMYCVSSCDSWEYGDSHKSTVIIQKCVTWFAVMLYFANWKLLNVIFWNPPWTFFLWDEYCMTVVRISFKRNYMH